MRAFSYLLPLLLAPSTALAAEPLATDTVVSGLNPGGPIQTFSSAGVTTAGGSSLSLTLSSASTTTSALHPSEPTGISGGAGTATGAGSSASATTTPSSEGSVCSSSRLALVVALGSGLLGWVAF